MVAKAKPKALPRPPKPTVKAGGPRRAPRRPKTGQPRRANMGPVDIFNPMNKFIPPTLMSEGTSFPVFGLVRNNYVTIAARTRIVFMTNTGRTGTMGMYLDIDEIGGVGVVGSGVLTIPTLAAADDAGGPTSSRPLKGSLGILNSTAALTRGGRAFVLNANQRLVFPAAPSVMNHTQGVALIDTILGHDKTRPYSGSDFAWEQTFVPHPTSDVEYTVFGENLGTLVADTFAAHVAIWPSAVPRPRPMSTVILVLQAAPSPQDYTFTFRAASLTRWPLNTVLGQNMTKMPVATSVEINKQRDAAEQLAHVPRSAGGGR